MGIGKILDGQVVLVTVASSGMGKTIAEAMGEAGARVVVNDISDENARFFYIRSCLGS
ncbi:MAG: SDR family NAD(P)-dependent oxidoreductase [Desulfobacterales bacterium]